MNFTESQPSSLHLTRHRPKRHKGKSNVKCENGFRNEINSPLTPDVLQPSGPALVDSDHATIQTSSVRKIGNFILLEKIDTNLISVVLYKAVNVQTEQQYLCKVVPINRYRDVLVPYLRAGVHENINEVQEVILGESEAYFFFLENYGDLHTYVRDTRRLKEPEAAKLFAQIVSAVKHCHENGIVIRDLKLRKLVFKNRERTKLMLEGFEDSIILPEADGDEYCDTLTDKHGCPVYVSPEILQSTSHYSGFLADVWSLGVILYTMLLGCYPFHDTNIGALFSMIRHGQYTVPPTISFSARCLIKNILRMQPSERLNVSEILNDPWFKQCETRSSRSWQSEPKEHVVPTSDSMCNADVVLF